MTDYTCSQCNTIYTRKCDFMRHFKKSHDNTCNNYNEYLIKYKYKTHPLCESCKSNKVIVRKNIISLYCSECTKIKTSLQLKNSAISRFSDEKIKSDILSKRKNTTLLKYGVSHISQLDTIKTKKKETIYNKYGVSSALDVPSVKSSRHNALVQNKDLINKKRHDAWTDKLIEQAHINRTNTNISKYNVEYPTKLQHIKQSISNKAKIRYTSIEYKTKCINNLLLKYNVINVGQLPYVQQLIKNTSNIKYNSSHYLSSNLRRYREELKGNWIPLSMLNEFDKYHRLCIIETRKHIKQLLNDWNGLCYYTNMTLYTNKSDYNNPLYRTIDHKISIYDGYMKNIDPSIIGNISNLCICSRSYNSHKGITSHE